MKRFSDDTCEGSCKRRSRELEGNEMDGVIYVEGHPEKSNERKIGAKGKGVSFRREETEEDVNV